MDEDIADLSLNEMSNSESALQKESMPNQEEPKGLLERPFNFKKIIKVVIDKEREYMFYKHISIFFILSTFKSLYYI